MLRSNWIWHGALWAVILVALLLSVWLAVDRVGVERDFNRYEIAVFYDEVLFLAGYEDPAGVMQELRDSGVTAVFFREQTLEQAAQSGLFEVYTAPQLREQPWLAGVEESDLPTFPLYLVTRDAQVYNHLSNQIRMKTGEIYARELPDGFYVLAAPFTPEYLERIGVGFPMDGMEKAAAAGLNVIPQVRSWPGVTTDGLAALADVLGEVPNLSAVAFNDGRIPGHPALNRVLAREFTPLGVPVANIEFFDQAGLVAVAQNLPARQVMLHAISAEEMPLYTPNRAADRMVLAATERNARILLTRMFTDPVIEEDLLTQNTTYIQGVHERLKAAGLSPAAPQAPAPSQPPLILVMVIGAGVIAGGLLLWERLQLGRYRWVVGLTGLLFWLALLVVLDLNQAAKIAALAAVVVFPSLAVLTVVQLQGTSLPVSILRFIQASGISLIGALFLVGLLSDTGFLIKLDQFAGVKLAHLLPLLLVGGYLAFYPTSGRSWLAKVWVFMKKPLLVFYGALGVAVLAVLALYIMRTGNEPAMTVSALEMQFRAFLDQTLAVRPRTKEFLLGHPWMLLLLFTGYRNVRYLPLVALGVIGQISLVNTFAHLHTPLLISSLRAFHGLWLGLLGGLVLIALWLLVKRYWPRILDWLERRKIFAED